MSSQWKYVSVALRKGLIVIATFGVALALFITARAYLIRGIWVENQSQGSAQVQCGWFNSGRIAAETTRHFPYAARGRTVSCLVWSPQRTSKCSVKPVPMSDISIRIGDGGAVTCGLPY